MAQQRRTFRAEEKVAILRRHLLDGVAVSDLCDEHGLNDAVLTMGRGWGKSGRSSECGCSVRLIAAAGRSIHESLCAERTLPWETAGRCLIGRV